MLATPTTTADCSLPDADGAPLHVLHVVAGNLYGGVERMLATIARHAPSSTTSIHEFALCFPGRLQNDLAARGAAVHHLGAVKFSKPWTVLNARRRLGKLIATLPVASVVFHGCWPLAVFGPRRSEPQYRSVLWVHDAITGRHWVERLAHRRHIDQFIANSRWIHETAARWRPDVMGDSLVCPADLPSSPHSRHGQTRREWDCDENTVVIVQVSRFETWKGHRQLLEAANLLQSNRALPPWQVWFVGGAQRAHEADYLQALQQATNDWGLTSRIRWLGQRSDVPQVLADADIFCQPNSSPEPLGLVFLEAMAQGLPVVTMNFGGAREVVPPGAGRLVPPGDIPALADALAGLIGDSSTRAEMRSVGPSHARQLANPIERLRDLECLLSKPVREGRS